MKQIKQIVVFWLMLYGLIMGFWWHTLAQAEEPPKTQPYEAVSPPYLSFESVGEDGERFKLGGVCNATTPTWVAKEDLRVKAEGGKNLHSCATSVKVDHAVISDVDEKQARNCLVNTNVKQGQSFQISGCGFEGCGCVDYEITYPKK